MMCFRDKFGIVAVVNTRETREYGEEDGGEKGRPGGGVQPGNLVKESLGG